MWEFSGQENTKKNGGNRMKGAKEFAELFPSGQYGKLRIVSGEHARGKTFGIYIGSCNENEVEVYGMVSGHPGWTETYGWIYKGPWVCDFESECAKRREILKLKAEKNFTEVQKMEQAEQERRKKVMENY
jgi:hypothetical protein